MCVCVMKVCESIVVCGEVFLEVSLIIDLFKYHLQLKTTWSQLIENAGLKDYSWAFWPLLIYAKLPWDSKVLTCLLPAHLHYS